MRHKSSMKNIPENNHKFNSLAWIFVSNNRTPIKRLEMLGDFHLGLPVASLRHAKVPTAKYWRKEATARRCWGWFGLLIAYQ